MKRSFLIHGLWALVTIGAFALGELWSFSSGDRDAREPQAAGGPLQSTRSLPTPSGAAATARLSDPSTRNARAEGDRADGASEPDPLSPEQIDSLARASIRSGSPVERRLAFARILRAMQTPGLTPGGALAIREAMKEYGAREGWKLLDYAWGAHFPDAAIAHLEAISPEAQIGFLQNMIPGLASENPDMAIDLFESLGSELQAKIRPRFLEGLVDNNAVVATDYLYESTNLEDYNWRPMDELARELVRDRGLKSTLEWAAELPEGSLRGSAWSAAYAVWASQDPQAASQSILEMPEGTDRNLAINGLVSAHAHEDGASAVIWAAEIAEPSLREAAMIRVGRKYYAQDPQAATQWFASSGLPQTVWERVTNSNR